MTENYKLVYHGNKVNLPAVRDAGSFYLTDDTHSCRGRDLCQYRYRCW